MPFLLTCTLLTPLAWVILNGPKPALIEIAGGLIALGWLARKGQLLALRHVFPFLAAGIVYATAGYIAADRNDLVMYSYQMAALLLFYGLPAGLCLRRLAERGDERQVAGGLLVFAIGMALISLVILRLPEVQRITGETAGTFQRTNGDENEITYLRFFSLSNIIIGVIPFTLFAVAALPAALTTRSLPLRLFVCVTVVVAVYANVMIATRTALLAGAVAAAVVLLLSWRHVPRRQWLYFAGAVSVIALVATFYFRQNDARLSYLIERFGAAGEDGRLPIWSEALALVLRFPQGQVAGHLQTHSWAHNLFLDVGLTNGWTAIAAVMAMFAWVYFQVTRRLLAGRFFDSTSNVIMLSWLLATSFAGMIQPPQPAFLALLHLACGFFAPVLPTRRAMPIPSAPPASAYMGIPANGAPSGRLYS